jgi:hypothetical protein
MKLWTGAKVLSTKLFSREKGARDYAGFLLAEGLCSLLYRPICSDHGRIWLDDERFFHYYRSFRTSDSLLKMDIRAAHEWSRLKAACL